MNKHFILLYHHNPDLFITNKWYLRTEQKKEKTWWTVGGLVHMRYTGSTLTPDLSDLQEVIHDIYMVCDWFTVCASYALLCFSSKVHMFLQVNRPRVSLMRKQGYPCPRCLPSVAPVTGNSMCCPDLYIIWKHLLVTSISTNYSSYCENI